MSKLPYLPPGLAYRFPGIHAYLRLSHYGSNIQHLRALQGTHVSIFGYCHGRGAHAVNAYTLTNLPSATEDLENESNIPHHIPAEVAEPFQLLLHQSIPPHSDVGH